MSRFHRRRALPPPSDEGLFSVAARRVVCRTYKFSTVDILGERLITSCLLGGFR